MQDDFARQLPEYNLFAEELPEYCVHQILVQVLVQRLIVDGPQLDQDVWDVFQEEFSHSRY